jgi:hypothetical protein
VSAVRSLDTTSGDIVSADILAGVAATAAALFSGATLVLVPGRERQKWIRESSVDSYEAFLNDSFESGLVCADARRILARGDQVPDELRLHTRELHDRKNQHRSRLRLLAPTPVIRAMTGVHEADDHVVDLAFQYPLCPHPQWQAAIDARKAARRTFVNTVRGALKLPGTGIDDL